MWKASLKRVERRSVLLVLVVGSVLLSKHIIILNEESCISIIFALFCITIWKYLSAHKRYGFPCLFSRRRNIPSKISRRLTRLTVLLFISISLCFSCSMFIYYIFGVFGSVPPFFLRIIRIFMFIGRRRNLSNKLFDVFPVFFISNQFLDILPYIFSFFQEGGAAGGILYMNNVNLIGIPDVNFQDAEELEFREERQRPIPNPFRDVQLNASENGGDRKSVV